MSKLDLAVLAQAIQDLINEPGVTDEEAESALRLVARHPDLIKKLQRMPRPELLKWAQRLETALNR